MPWQWRREDSMSTHRINRAILQSFVPLNALSPERLDHVLEGQEIEALPAGTVLCQQGASDGQTLYLLSGTVLITDGKSPPHELDAGDIDAAHAVAIGQPRPATVTAKTAVNVLRLESKRLDRVLAWDQSTDTLLRDLSALYPMDDNEWISRLLQSRLFYRLPPTNIVELFRHLKTETLPVGQRVLRMGDRAECCYFIRSGVVEVSIPGERGPVTLALLEKGQYFGEEGLLIEGTRNADVSMVSAGQLMRLDKADFDRLLKSPTLAMTDFASAMGAIEAKQASWLDVRLPEEQEMGILQTAICMPLQSLRVKSRLLPREKRYIVYCDTGRRSMAAAFLLGVLGYDIEVLDGGLWSLLPAERDRYLISGS